MELGHLGAETAGATEHGRAAIGLRAFKVALLLVVSAAFGVGAFDLTYARTTRSILEKAALEAARIAVSSPLHSASCKDRTPCSIQSAAAAAKEYLAKAGSGETSCINPKSPSFSGVLVWVFSCDGSKDASCNASSGSVCVAIDMTAVVAGQNGALIPSTRVTVQYPHSWAVESVLGRLPGRPSLPLPKSLSANAVVSE